MSKNKSREEPNANRRAAGQGHLWPYDLASRGPDVVPNDPTPQSSVATTEQSRRPEEQDTKLDRRTIQDFLPAEGLIAVKISDELDSLEDLQCQLVAHFRQNSLETRTRYAQSVLLWFFSDGLAGLAQSVWAAYKDESIERDILRYLYLTSEPIMGACVSEALFPLEEGMLVPGDYLDRFLRQLIGGEVPPKPKERAKTNLMKLGFLARSRGKPDRLNPVVPSKTAFIILLHHIFAASGQRTVEIRNLFANPFWKYLGFKSEDSVRKVMRSADAAGLLGKYVVADQLEQITTCLTLNEILTRGIRL